MADLFPLVLMSVFVVHLLLFACLRADRGNDGSLNRRYLRGSDRAYTRPADWLEIDRTAADGPDFTIHAPALAVGQRDR